MLRHVQCTYPKLSWLFVLVAACSLAACGGSIGGDSVTGSPVSLSASEPELESTFEQAKGGGKHHRRHHDRDDDDDDGERDDDDDDGDSDDDDDDGERDDRGRRHRDRDDDDDDDDDKVLVCHKGRKTLRVSQEALRGHLRHGDTLGSCTAATCPCFSVNDINAAAQCSGNLSSQCSTGDPAFLFLTCDAGSTGVLGIYASATASGGSCSRDDVHGSVSQNGLNNAEYQACVNVIKASGYC